MVIPSSFSLLKYFQFLKYFPVNLRFQDPKFMSQNDNLRFQVQILARCFGTALELGKPVKVEVHFRDGLKNPASQGSLALAAV